MLGIQRFEQEAGGGHEGLDQSFQEVEKGVDERQKIMGCGAAWRAQTRPLT